MKNETQHHLVKGSFNKNEAEEIIHSLFMNKINFHTFTAFCLKEQNGVETPVHDQRVRELKNSLEDILDFINKNSNDKLKVEINCSIKVRLI